MSTHQLTSEELDMQRFYEFICDRHPELQGDDEALLAWESGFYDDEFMRWQAREAT